MPRTTDHEARREQLAAAVWRLVSDGGVEAVSLRSVAAEAGVSMGRVQYYFSTKDDLLLDGLRFSHRYMERRIGQRLEGSAGDERTILVAILDELLGEHPQTRDAIRVHSAFAARAVTEEMADVLTDGDEEILALTVRVVAEAVASGRAAPGTDPEIDGFALWTLARGLGGDVALYGAPVERARRTLHHVLDRIAPPPGAREQPCRR
ncbi:TetR/AcrR family transcriptional regulator [Pseudonocardia sp. HH130630-07]|uniref:TetR/AcrR family transcriptional regulator n=1 Tax=Pseudonocardia sp. HH130630-07 TaxID=1690815 RepID=UPI0008151672|nr:TetR family transcriptional regulator C-terminal domain-containing protein [Pseudonocardia sp. HH130630-07]ANY05574.1 hypothetical protein AFB00_03800 [Pseudonocardia sp. HH130630-07]